MNIIYTVCKCFRLFHHQKQKVISYFSHNNKSSSSSMTSSTDDDNNNLPGKVQKWQEFARKKENTVNIYHTRLTNCFDLTTSPTKKGASFPYSILPPLRQLTFDELLNEFIRLPSVTTTAFGSFVSGVLFALGMNSMFSFGRRNRSGIGSVACSSSSNSAAVPSLSNMSRPFRAILSIIASILIIKWVSTRFPKKQLLSTSLNVSSHSGGPCCVTGPVVMITNSHAGTHADTPAHFTYCPSSSSSNNNNGNTSESSSNNNSLDSKEFSFHRSCYTGDCIMLDVSSSLESRRTSEIDDAILQDAVSRSSDTDFQWDKIWRIIICTKRLLTSESHRKNDEWRDNFAYFSVSGASFLATQCPNLMMIGTDSPSVDRVDASPLIQNSHGVFWRHRIAIVENIDCSSLYEKLTMKQIDGILEGEVQCVFNDAQKFEDAEGCNVLFYPTV